MVAGLAAGAVLISREDPPPPFPDMAISGWAPYWALPEATASVQANATVLHEISPFWFQANADGTVGLSGNVPLDQLAAFTQTATASGATVLPSISDGTKQGEMAAMLADPGRRSAHVDAIVTLVRDNGFDGIDIDYEGFAFTDDRTTWDAIRPNWVRFLQDLSAALHADGKLLSVSVPPIYDTGRTPDSGFWVYDYAAMGDLVDRIRIMAYDYSVAEPGPIAPYAWVRVAVKAAKRAVGDDSRIVLGIGLYGRNWVVSTRGTCPSTAEGTTTVSLRNVEALAAKRGGAPVHNEVTGEASFGYDLEVTDGSVTCTQTRRVHYVDEQGALARVDLAREERIGGVSFWALGFDSDAVWDTVAAVARPQGAPAPAP